MELNMFRMGTTASVVERRLLVNYRCEPEVVARLLPAPLRPQLANGWAVAGICLIRLGSLRPGGLPPIAGLRTENAAHRISVEWDEDGERRTGVYIPRRHSGSRVTAALGGRVFPGMHGLARFDVLEGERHLFVGFKGAGASVAVDAEVVRDWPGGQLFTGLDEASAFFRGGARGWSTSRDPGRLDGLELRMSRWAVEPVAVRSAHSSLYTDPELFPPGSIALDTTLLMRDVPATWHALPQLAVEPGTALLSGAGG